MIGKIIQNIIIYFCVDITNRCRNQQHNAGDKYHEPQLHYFPSQLYHTGPPFLTQYKIPIRFQMDSYILCRGFKFMTFSHFWCLFYNRNDF